MYVCVGCLCIFTPNAECLGCRLACNLGIRRAIYTPPVGWIIKETEWQSGYPERSVLEIDMKRRMSEAQNKRKIKKKYIMREREREQRSQSQVRGVKTDVVSKYPRVSTRGDILEKIPPSRCCADTRDTGRRNALYCRLLEWIGVNRGLTTRSSTAICPRPP